jgi:hypothetical protein
MLVFSVSLKRRSEGITALPLAPTGAESAAGLHHGVVAIEDQAIHAVVSGLDQVRIGDYQLSTTSLGRGCPRGSPDVRWLA